jgi:hypothetical protein
LSIYQCATTFTIVTRDGTTLDVVVDDEDWDEVSQHRWHMTGGKGSVGRYATNQRGVYLHRLIAVRAGILESFAVQPGLRGAWSESVDHANGDKLDNRRCNLRLRDRNWQMRNPNDAVRKTNRSGHRGVSFVASRERFGKPWMAYVTVNYQTINLGWYATVDDAADARRRWDEQNPSGTTVTSKRSRSRSEACSVAVTQAGVLAH